MCHCYETLPRFLKCLFEIKCTKLHKHFESSINIKRSFTQGMAVQMKSVKQAIKQTVKACISYNFTRQHIVLKSLQQSHTMRSAWPGP